MKKQTAVEWLIRELMKSKDYQRVINDVNQIGTEVKDVIQQARAMEKEQNEHYIRFAYMAGFNRGLDNNPNHLEEYIEYIKTFDL